MKVDEATLHALEWDTVRGLIAGYTSAPLARDTLTAWDPIPDLEAARQALSEVSEGIRVLSGEDRLPAPHVEDHSATLRVLGVEGATLDGMTLVAAARTLEGVRKLATYLRRGAEEWPLLADRFRNAPAERELEKKLLNSFDGEGRLVDDASPDLKRLREEVRRHRAGLVELLEKVIAGLHHALVSADSRPTVREGRYVVPARREALSGLPGIVHDESTSGATVFIEPHEAVNRNNALRQTELAVRREEHRILRELTKALAERRGELELAARLALHAETVFARARYALAVDGHPPSLGESELELRDARHPILMARAAEGEIGEVVPLTMILGPDQRTLVVTGPNTGGKTVLLKTLGAVTLMAQSGIIPPVGSGTRLPWHDALFADIGDTQSIAQDLSSFTAHLTRLKAAWDDAGPESLILVDEIGASTDPNEGAAMSTALLETWTDRGTRTVVTTHYTALKVLASTTPGMVNGSLAYDIERNLPQFRFVQGVPGRSFGLDLAERWGFGSELVGRARDHLDSGLRRLDEVVGRLVEEEKEMAEARHALEAERKAIGKAESARARKIEAEAVSSKEAAERRLSELEDQLGRLRQEARRQQRKLRHRTMELAEAEAEAEASRMLAEEAKQAEERLRAEREELAERGPSPLVGLGDRVRIPRYGVEGEVVEIERSEDTCAVQAGHVRISCRISECEILATTEEVAEEGSDAAGLAIEAGDGEVIEPALPLEIDLRGMTADEIGFPVAGALERAYHAGHSIVRFIHGKGTGVLRRRVGELLAEHPYVREYRLGYWNEGGDGITVARVGEDDEREGS